LCRHHRLAIFPRQSFSGAREEVPRPSGLKLHQLDKAVVVLSILEFLLRIIETRQILERQINPVSAQVFADVADNISHLQSQPELDGIFLTGGLAAIENFNSYLSDGAGQSITIDPQFIGRLVKLDAQEHFYA